MGPWGTRSSPTPKVTGSGSTSIDALQCMSTEKRTTVTGTAQVQVLLHPFCVSSQKPQGKGAEEARPVRGAPPAAMWQQTAEHGQSAPLQGMASCALPMRAARSPSHLCMNLLFEESIHRRWKNTSRMALGPNNTVNIRKGVTVLSF